MICALCKKDSGEFKTVELKNSKIYVCLKCVIDVGSMLIKQIYEKYEKNVFGFDDILQLDECSMAVVIKSIEVKNLSVALKNESREMIEHFKNHMSFQAAQILQDEISYLGQLRKKDIEYIKNEIVETIIKLEERGEIIINKIGGNT
jgi:flagellar motor switch protein FliG